MAAPSEAEIQTQWKNTVNILEKTRAYADNDLADPGGYLDVLTYLSMVRPLFLVYVHYFRAQWEGLKPSRQSSPSCMSTHLSWQQVAR